MSRWGERTIWHRTSCTHWDIRRYATLPGIVPEQIRDFPEIGSSEDRARFYWEEYRRSALRSMKDRLSFYALSTQAPYRRVSLNFSMSLDPSYSIGAYATPYENEEIFVSIGMIHAIEEASHAVFATANQLFELQEGEIWAHMTDMEAPMLGQSLGLRPGQDAMLSHETAFSDYPADAISELAKYCDATMAGVEGREDIIPALSGSPDFCFLHLCFSRLSMGSTRQALADEFSVLALTWVISHEDAHRYQGHLRYLDDALGAGTFRELVADYEDPEIAEARALIELDADSNATIRTMDFAYDVEFMGMMFDSVDPGIRQRIWRGRRERDGFDAAQRVLALRIIALSAMMPVLCFAIGKSGRTPNGYPPIAIRLLNIIFEVFDRTKGIETHHSEYLTGQIETPDEVLAFCAGALSDAVHCAQTLLTCKGRNLDSRLASDLSLVESGELAVLFGQFLGGLNGISIRYSPLAGFEADRLSEARLLITEFFDFKARCYRFGVEDLVDARRGSNAGNQVRQNKITEDLQFLDQKARWFAQASERNRRRNS